MSRRTSVQSDVALMERLCKQIAYRVDDRPRWMVPSVETNALIEELHEVMERLRTNGADDPGAKLALQIGARRLEAWRPLVPAVEPWSEQERSLVTALIDVRWVLHRYARHFSGQRRSTRDLSRLVASRRELVALTRRARELVEHTQDAQLAAEVQALPRFVEFLVQEQGEISDSLDNTGRHEQAQAMTILARELAQTWQQLSAPQRLVRSLPWMIRTVEYAQEVLERMTAVRHANLPEAYEEAIAQLSTSLGGWRRELDLTRAEQISATVEVRSAALHSYGQSLLEWVEARAWGGVDEPTERARWSQVCDQLDQTVGEVDALPIESPIRGELVAALLYCGKRFDAG